MLNNFAIVCGMPRTGTSYLYFSLQKHPDFFLPHRKEISFFCSNYQKGKSWYESFFNDRQEKQVSLDISPVYFLHPDSLDRIRRYNPHIKVILCIRKPSDWICSWYAQLSTREIQMPGFDQFLARHWFRPSIGEKFFVELENHFISQQIERYRHIFGTRILIYQYEFFKKDPLTVVRTIERFLGVSEYFQEYNLENIVINSSNRKNIWLFSYLLSRESIIRLLELCISKNKLRQIRTAFDKASTPKEGSDANSLISDSDIQLARSFFNADDEYVESLFFEHPIQLGNGQLVNIDLI